MIPFYDVNNCCIQLREEDTLTFPTAQAHNETFCEAIGEYVAELQLHMSLQARKLVPPLTQASDSRERLLQETQANIEKLVSRQVSELA